MVPQNKIRLTFPRWSRPYNIRWSRPLRSLMCLRWSATQRCRSLRLRQCRLMTLLRMMTVQVRYNFLTDPMTQTAQRPLSLLSEVERSSIWAQVLCQTAWRSTWSILNMPMSQCQCLNATVSMSECPTPILTTIGSLIELLD